MRLLEEQSSVFSYRNLFCNSIRTLVVPLALVVANGEIVEILTVYCNIAN